MKKFVILLLVVCLLFAAGVGYLDQGARPDAEFSPEPVADEEPVSSGENAAQGQAAPETAEPEVLARVDYDALYALHGADDIVMTIDGEPIRWEEYFAWLRMNAEQIESMMEQYALYGMTMNWTDAATETGTTYAQYAVSGAEDSLSQLIAIEGNAAALGFEKGEAFEAELKEHLKSDIEAVAGEGATEEDFYAALDKAGMTPEMYARMASANAVYLDAFERVYGVNGADMSDEAAMKFLEDGAYLSANHILLMTIDPASGEALDEATVQEKQAQAEKLYEELAAIEDSEARVARFKELKEQYCEDTGKTAYPDGYVFTPGTMVAEFEDACKALGDYELSAPVKSGYGYHVILRLPLGPDAVITKNTDGSEITARFASASNEYSGKLGAYMNAMEREYAEGFEAPDLLAFVK